MRGGDTAAGGCEDEFEEYRARSYSGGFSPRRRSRIDQKQPLQQQQQLLQQQRQHGGGSVTPVGCCTAGTSAGIVDNGFDFRPRFYNDVDAAVVARCGNGCPPQQPPLLSTQPPFSRSAVTMTAGVYPPSSSSSSRSRPMVESELMEVVFGGRIRKPTSTPAAASNNNHVVSSLASTAATSAAGALGCSAGQLQNLGRQPATSPCRNADMRPRVDSAPTERLRCWAAAGRAAGGGSAAQRLLVPGTEARQSDAGIPYSLQLAPTLPIDLHPLRKVRSFTIIGHRLVHERDQYLRDDLLLPSSFGRQPFPAAAAADEDGQRSPGSTCSTSCSGRSTTNLGRVASCFDLLAAPIRHRVVIAGVEGVGKSTVINRFLRSDRRPSLDFSIESEYQGKLGRELAAVAGMGVCLVYVCECVHWCIGVFVCWCICVLLCVCALVCVCECV